MKQSEYAWQKYGGRQVQFKPSLSCSNRLSRPKQVVKTLFLTCHAGLTSQHQGHWLPRRTTLRLFVLCSFISFLFQASVAASETRAVLVGVSDYDDEIGLADLKGPANDVSLLSEVLRNLGISDITVLADGPEGAIRPTHEAIVTALAKEAERAAPGDFVYLHFSGHGTRQPDRNGDETDGLDEVFLPADTGRAVAETGLISNALVDDDIGKAVDAIRAKGADVWLVLDSCHSGTGLRAGGVGGASRYVDPALLGVSVQPAAPGPAVDKSENEDLPGGFVAFYSARADEVAREYDLDPGEGEAYYGLFTAKLAARLADAQGWSFRQLFQAVLSDLNDTSLPGVARLQTPSWDGTLIDRPVLGDGEVSGARRFTMRGDELRAGIVHNIANGALLALYTGPADPEDQVLGYAQATSATATSAILMPVGSDCVPSTDSLCARQGQLPVEARFAQVTARPVDLTVRIAPPRDLSTGADLATDHPAVVGLGKAIAASDGAAMFDPLAFDVETVWDGKSLWFGRRAVMGGQPTGLSWTPGAEKLQPLLTRITRAEAYARLMDGLTGGGGMFNQNPVEITGMHLPSRVESLSPPGQPESTIQECGRAFQTADNDPVQPLDTHSEVKQCDRLMFQGKGRKDGIRDVNIVQIDAQYCVKSSYAQVSGFSAAAELGSQINICSDCPGGTYSAGDERYYMVITEAAENAAPLRLAGLIETCAGAGTRGPAQKRFLDTLGTMAKRPDTRGSFGSLGVSNIWVERYDITVQPRELVFRQAGAGN
ncbi:MAG: caspase domain-containing protein [Paracoccaceae bacterium]